jgi:hypothetical protein
VKDLLVGIRLDPDAVVPHEQPHAVALHLRPDLHVGRHPRGDELDRVANEAGEALGERRFVAESPCDRAANFDADLRGLELRVGLADDAKRRASLALWQRVGRVCDPPSEPRAPKGGCRRLTASASGLCALRVLLCQGLDRTGLEPVFTGGRKGRGGLTRRGRIG